MHSRRDNSPHSPWYEGYQLTKGQCGQPEDFQYSTAGPKLLYFQTYSGKLVLKNRLKLKVKDIRCLGKLIHIDSISLINWKYKQKCKHTEDAVAILLNIIVLNCR